MPSTPPDPYHQAALRRARTRFVFWLAVPLAALTILTLRATSLGVEWTLFWALVLGYWTAKVADPHIDQARSDARDARAWLTDDLDHHH